MRKSRDESAAEELLSTTDVARILAVGPSTVKRWGDEGRLPCVRTAGRHRRFHRHEVEKLRARLKGSDGEQGWASQWVDFLSERAEPAGVQSRLLADRARFGSWWRLAVELGSVLVELGTRWSEGQLTIVQEHVASARLERALAACAASLPSSPEAPTVLLAAAADDLHTLGLSLTELTAREAGWWTVWAGNRTPTAALVEHIEHLRPEVVALSASSESSDALRLAVEVEAVGAVCESIGALLALGGEGAWPEPSPRGVRVRSLGTFREILLTRSLQ